MILYGRDYYIWRNCGFVTTMIAREMFRMSGSVVPRAIPVACVLAMMGYLVASGSQIGWYQRLQPEQECRIILPSGRVLDALGNATALSQRGVLLDAPTANAMLEASGKDQLIGRAPRCEMFFRRRITVKMYPGGARPRPGGARPRPGGEGV